MDFSPVQIAIVVIIALIVFGPKRLPELGQKLGRGLREAKEQMNQLGQEMTRAVDNETVNNDRAEITASTAKSSTTSVAPPSEVTVRSTAADAADDADTVDDDADLLDGVVVTDDPIERSPSSDGVPSGVFAEDEPLAEDDLLDGVVVSGDTPPRGAVHD